MVRTIKHDVPQLISGKVLTKAYDWYNDPKKYKTKIRTREGTHLGAPFNRCFHCARRFVGSDARSVGLCCECDRMMQIGGEDVLVSYNEAVINCRVPLPDDAKSYDWTTLTEFTMDDADIKRVDRTDIRKAIESKLYRLVDESPNDEMLPTPDEIQITWDEYVQWNLKKAKRRQEHNATVGSSNFTMASDI